MNLRNLDLNLLLVFDAIYGERSISKAAHKLHLSQPTVSNALARLRVRLDDPLFERGSQAMLPTQKAKALAEPIRQALDLIERGLRGHSDFDYAQSDREFVIAVEDYGETIILPRFIDWLSKVAPGIRVRLRPEPASTLKALFRDGAVDFALDYFTIDNKGFRSECVLTETLLTLSRRDHPEVGEKMSLDTYLSLRHVVLAPREGAMPMIDLALSKRGLQRKIAVTVPHFLAMPVMAQSTDMICNMPRRMAQMYADHFRLRSHAVPLRIPQYPVYLLWHQAAEEDAGHQWFRTQLTEFCQRL